MTPKEKAIELYDKYYNYLLLPDSIVKQCALIAVDEILNQINSIGYTPETSNLICYFIEVKQEIEKL